MCPQVFFLFFFCITACYAEKPELAFTIKNFGIDNDGHLNKIYLNRRNYDAGSSSFFLGKTVEVTVIYSLKT